MPPTEIILTLSVTEAMYVYGALNKVSPVGLADEEFGGGDPIYDALYSVLLKVVDNPNDGLSYSAAVGLVRLDVDE